MTKTQHLGFLCDIGELSASLAGSTDIDSFLCDLVRIVATHLKADVCSIYLYEDDTNQLVLRENVGLDVAKVGVVRLAPDEGLVGLAYSENRVILENNASKHPRYKHFHGLDEERYESFLAVPVTRGNNNGIGVLVVQRRTAHHFSKNDANALRATGSQLAGAIENVRILTSLQGETPTQNLSRAAALAAARGPADLGHIACRVASEGLACAECLNFSDEFGEFLYRDVPINGSFSQQDFLDAVKQTEHQLEDLQTRLEKRLPEVASLIFSAHILMLKDRSFTGRMVSMIESGTTPPTAILTVARRYIDIFKASENAYIREKVQDVEDLAKRLMGNLAHKVVKPTADCDHRIVIAKELYPSDVLKLASENVAGIILVGGGVTSHVSILASSLDIPTLIADDKRLLKIPDGTTLLLDAEQGDLYVAPPDSVIDDFRERQKAHRAIEEALDSMAPTTTMTDGTRVHLLANINLLSEVTLARRAHAEGIGLYRTEFPFLIRPDFPSEEEQLVVYESLVESMPDSPVTFRTLDVGGDKILPYVDSMAKEENPILGMRSIRFSLHNPLIFRAQLRAILRAGSDCPGLRIMFPMISSVAEFRAAKAELTAAMEELDERRLPYHESPQIGIMVEIPSVVHVIDDIAKEVDFFCVGTNDFIQFMLAVDRTNEKVAPFFDPGHPAVLRALKIVADAANRNKIDLSVCGEMAHDAKFIPFLVGIGISRLSINPRYLPRVQQQITAMSLAEAQAAAQSLLDNACACTPSAATA